MENQSVFLVTLLCVEFIWYHVWNSCSTLVKVHKAKLPEVICVTMQQAIVSYFTTIEGVFKKTHTAFRLRLWKRHLLLYIFFWVFPRRQIVVGRRFGTLYQFHLQRLGVQCTPRVPKRRPTTIWSRGNTQKKIYNIQITAKVWNQESWNKMYAYLKSHTALQKKTYLTCTKHSHFGLMCF